MEFLIKNYGYIIAGIIILGIFIIIVHQLILRFLEKRDFIKNYSEEKLRNKMRKREDDNGKFYYGINYYVWQKNKLRVLHKIFPTGEYFTDKLVTTDAVTYSTLTDKIFSNGKRASLYKMEFRVYYKISEIRKSVVNNFIHNGIGNQNNNIYQNENNTNMVINQLENFLNEIDVESNDETYIESFIYKMSQGKETEDDKNKIIETLSKYTSVGSDVISIISNVANFFGM